jgi:hypothetical protein
VETEQMTDTEVYRALRERSQQKRADNREASVKLLRDRGIEFTEHNNGAHLKIGNIDFYPGTGLWINVKARLKRRGVRGPLRHLRDKA